MTHSINNPNKFATNDEPETSAFTPSAILDATDFPHTGLLKALNRQAAGNIVISGFNITSANATNLAVANGVILKDGKREDITLSGSMVLQSTINNLYHLLVVDDNLTKQIRNPGGVADKIPALNDGDTVIAVLKYTGSDPMQVQYLTNWKTSNSISLAHDNAGTTYTEEGQITANTGGGVDFTTTATNADIRITPNGSGKIVLDGLNWPIADGSADQVLKTDGSGQLSFVAQSGGDIVDDTTPQLGGNLDVQTNAIVSTSNRDIAITPDGTGKVDITGDLKVSGVQYQQFQDLTGDLSVGWHSIALIEGQSGGSGAGTGSQAQRGIGTFLVRNTDSSRHQTIMLTASHLFGGGNGNGISVEHSSYFSTIGITQFRLKEASTYDGAALQIYIADATNDIEIYLKNNFQETGWQLIQAVADGTDPSTVSLGLGYNTSWASFGAANTTDITTIAQLGQHIQGLLTVKNIRTTNEIEINGDLDHDGSNVGFYGTAPASKQTVGNLAATSVITRPIADPTANPGFEPGVDAYVGSLEAEIGNLRTKLDALIDALQLYGLIS